MELELLQLLSPDVHLHKQVNLTQTLTKCQADHHKKSDKKKPTRVIPIGVHV